MTASEVRADDGGDAGGLGDAMSAPGRPVWQLSAREWILLCLLFVFSVVVRIPFLSTPMIGDEGFYAYIAMFWSDDYTLYGDVPIDRPQAIFWLYQAILYVLGGSVEAVRLFTSLFNAFTTAALFLFARDVSTTRQAVVASTVYAVFSTSPHLEGFTGNAEIFTLLPLVVSAHATWRRQWFLAGVTAAIATLLKPSGIWGVALAGLWLIKVCGLSSLVPFAKLGAGVLVGLAPSLAHFAWIGLGVAWKSLYEYRLALYEKNTLSPAVLWTRFVSGTYVTVAAWIAPAIGTIGVAFRPLGGLRLFGALWLLSSVLGVAMGGWWRWHYFMQIIPPLSFLFAIGLPLLWASSLRRFWLVAIGLAIALFAQRELPYFAMTPKAISWELYRRPAYLVGDAIAEHVVASTSESDRVYVAFSEPELYYLSQRKAAIPVFYFDHVMLSDAAFREVVSGIRDRVPALVVMVQAPPRNRMSTREFVALLSPGYFEERRIEIGNPVVGQVVFYRRRDESR